MKSILSLLGANRSQMLDVMIRTGLRAESSRAGRSRLYSERRWTWPGDIPGYSIRLWEILRDITIIRKLWYPLYYRLAITTGYISNYHTLSGANSTFFLLSTMSRLTLDKNICCHILSLSLEYYIFLLYASIKHYSITKLKIDFQQLLKML